MKQLLSKLEAIEQRLSVAEQGSEEKERQRSLVLIGVADSTAERPSARAKMKSKFWMCCHVQCTEWAIRQDQDQIRGHQGCSTIDIISTDLLGAMEKE